MRAPWELLTDSLTFSTYILKISVHWWVSKSKPFNKTDSYVLYNNTSYVEQKESQAEYVREEQAMN